MRGNSFFFIFFFFVFFFIRLFVVDPFMFRHHRLWHFIIWDCDAKCVCVFAWVPFVWQFNGFHVNISVWFLRRINTHTHTQKKTSDSFQNESFDRICGDNAISIFICLLYHICIIFDFVISSFTLLPIVPKNEKEFGVCRIRFSLSIWSTPYI